MRTTALVLSYDPNRVCTENMILQYERLLGSEHFRFLVPYQENRELSGAIRSEVELVRCGPSIRDTVAALLGRVEETEMVYWCIDDKFPLELDAGAFRTVLHRVHALPGVDGVSLAAARRLARGGGLKRGRQRLPGVAGVTFLERTNFNQFWLHQFMRARCIGYVFSRFPEQMAAAKEMDDHLDRLTGNPFRMYVANRNRIVFGESTSRGALTEGFVEAAAANGLAVDPGRARTAEEIRIGQLGRQVRFRPWWRLF